MCRLPWTFSFYSSRYSLKILSKYRLFTIFRYGKYRITPVYVDDVTREAGKQSPLTENVTGDLVGPETSEFGELIDLITREMGTHLRTLNLSRISIPVVNGLLSLIHHERVVTFDEMRVVLDNLLYSRSNPIGVTRFSSWLEAHRETFGEEYHSEIERHFKPRMKV